MSIYDKLKKAGVKLSNHSSDLYAEKTDVSEQIISEYQFKGVVTTFLNRIDGKIWYDIPFGFKPFWDKVEAGQCPY